MCVCKHKGARSANATFVCCQTEVPRGTNAHMVLMLQVYASTMAQTVEMMRAELAQLRENMHAAMAATGHVRIHSALSAVSCTSHYAWQLPNLHVLVHVPMHLVHQLLAIVACCQPWPQMVRSSVLICSLDFLVLCRCQAHAWMAARTRPQSRSCAPKSSGSSSKPARRKHSCSRHACCYAVLRCCDVAGSGCQLASVYWLCWCCNVVAES